MSCARGPMRRVLLPSSEKKKKIGEKRATAIVCVCVRARDARLDTCNFGQTERARTRVYAPCTLFTIMRSLHRPGSRRSSNSERQGQTRPYMDGWTNTTYAFVLARSFVSCPCRRIGAKLTRTRRREYLYRCE